MNIEKIGKGISSCILGIVLLFAIWKVPHPQFNTMPSFFVPAYYVVLTIAFTALIINGLAIIKGRRKNSLAKI